MTALITGAAGFVGGRLSARLAAAGTHTRGLCRDLRQVPRLERAGVEPVRGDVTDPASL